MSTEQIKQFNIIGISVRTTNENQQAATDIPALWNRFMTEGIMEKIPDKVDQTIYCIYTDYEKDHTKPYTTILGCTVKNLDNIPRGFIGKTIEAGSFKKFTAKGNLTQGAVYNEWIKIWNADIQRSFTTDFEMYSEKAKNFEDGEVDIFISLR